MLYFISRIVDIIGVKLHAYVTKSHTVCSILSLCLINAIVSMHQSLSRMFITCMHMLLNLTQFVVYSHYA